MTWVKAHDTPLHRDDLSLEQEQLDAKRKRWLSFHDQRTAGILGLLPLAKGLPVRLTDSVDRPLKLYKHRRGVIVGWVLHADEASAVSGNQRLLDCGWEEDVSLHRPCRQIRPFMMPRNYKCSDRYPCVYVCFDSPVSL